MGNNPVNFSDPTGHKECDYKCQVEYEGADPDFEHYCEDCKWDIGKQKKNKEIAETVLYGGIELAASILFEPADWAYTSYHCASGDCSPWMLLGLLPIIPSSLGKYGDDIARGVGRIDPRLLRFSQDSIGYFFRNGDSIDDLADGLRAGYISPDDIPPVRLATNSDGLLFTLDNRRLEAFRRAGVDIPFVLATANEITAEAWKFTTRVLGESIRIR